MSEPTLNNSQISASTSFVSSTSDSTSASRVPAEPMKAEGPREEVKPVFMLERAGPGIKRYKSPQASLCLFEGDKKVVEEIKAEMERIVDEAEANEATSTSTSPRHRSIKGTPKLESQPGSVHSDTFDLLEPTNGPQKTPQGGTGYKSSFRSLGATDGPQKTPQGGTGYKSSFRSLGATSGPQSDAAAIKLTDSSFDIESKCDLPSEKQRHKSYAERWEEAIKEIVIAGTLGDSENANNRRDKAYEQIATVCNDFKTAAVAYSRIIILEKRENAQNKTIPQFFCNGEIGGTKYRIFDKIFFKFSEKDKEHYKDNDSAGKVSGHEIKSASYLLSAVMNKDLYKDLIPEGGVATPEDEKKIKDKVIVPPLMVLIDYLGYRIIAMPVLPVGKITKANNETESTLIYGSNDALQTFKNDESIDAELEKVTS